MIAQPLRLGGLAVAYALATATLVLVTVVAANLVLSVVAVLGPEVPAGQPADRGPVEQVRLAADGDGADGRKRCDQPRDKRSDRHRVAPVDGSGGAVRCGVRRAGPTPDRP